MALEISRCLPVDDKIQILVNQINDIETEAGTTIIVQEEGTPLGSFGTLNFVGTIITAADAGGGVATITVVGTAGSQDVFTNVAVAGQTDVVADSTTDTLTFIAGANIDITTAPADDSVTFAVTGLNIFDAIIVSGQSTVTATSTSTDLTFVAGSNMTITTDNTAKSVTFASSGGGGAAVNVITAKVNDAAGADPGDATVAFDTGVAILGTADTTGTIDNTFGDRLNDNEDVVLLDTGGNWAMLQRKTGAIFRTTTTIGASSYNTGPGKLTVGSGSGKQFVLDSGSTTVYHQLVGTETIYNMVTTAIATGRNIQCKLIDGLWFADVEDCAS
jgi:hypothetical protein